VTGLGWTIHAFDDLDSTQTVLHELARAGASEGTVVTARHQREGRGRQGRRWWDSPGDALLLSALLRPAVPSARLPELSLVAASAVSDALEQAARVGAHVRPPNDVLIAGRKVSGILPDATSYADGRVGYVALGIGINVNQVEFPADVAERATSLRLATGRPHDVGELRQAVLDSLGRHYELWLQGRVAFDAGGALAGRQGSPCSS